MEVDNYTDTPEVEGEGQEEVIATPTESGDPLDAISDPDELRKIAKSRGAAYVRVKTERDELKTTLTPTSPDQKPVTVEHLRSIAMKDAKEQAPADIQANWDKLMDYIPPKHRSASTAKEIIKAMQTAQAAYLADNPQSTPDAGQALATDAGVVGGSQTVKPSETPAEDPRFSKPKGPESWYSK